MSNEDVVVSDAEMLWFWSLIDSRTGDPDGLASDLRKLTRAELECFGAAFDEATADLTDEEFRAQLRFRSDDNLWDLAATCVSQGERFYREVLDDPGRMAEVERREDLKTLAGVANHIYIERFGRPLPVRS